MPRLLPPALIPTVLLACWLGSGVVHAQASRTWVSGVGDDANPCSRTAPCKTFAGAISKTSAGGEIDALDPGGFGALTITKPITIDGGGGQVASVLVSGTNAIVIVAGPNDAVTLRNLRLNGLRHSGNGGLNGVQIISGAAVHIENCYIFGFSQNGINVVPNGVTSRVFVIDTILSDNNNGAFLQPADGGVALLTAVRTQAKANSSIGFVSNGGGGTTVVSLDRSQALANGVGLSVSGGGSFGFLNTSEFLANTTGVSATGVA